MVDVKIIRVDPQQPVKARYKAIGMAAPGRARPAGLDYVPLVFDPEPRVHDRRPRRLGRGGPAARRDPARVRLQGLPRQPDVHRDPVRDRPGDRHHHHRHRDGAGHVRRRRRPGHLDLTAARDDRRARHAARHRRGVDLGERGIRGAFDITVTPAPSGSPPPVHRRRVPTANVGVLFGGLVELPVPIVLGSSGLGIYGFLGGMGVNFERVMPGHRAAGPGLGQAAPGEQHAVQRPGRLAVLRRTTTASPPGWCSARSTAGSP